MIREIINRFRDSWLFTFKNTSAIAVNGYYTFDFAEENKSAGKFLPFNSTQILNYSMNDVKLFLNAGEFMLMRCSERTITEPLHYLKIQNTGTASILTSEIIILAQKVRAL
jgi:hypothetical protein